MTDETGTGSLVFAGGALGAATATTLNGSTVSPGHYSGEPSTGNALAGEIGEYVSSTITLGASISLTSGVPVNITSISLTAGDWDVAGVIGFIPGTTTSVTQFIASSSTTTGTVDSTPGRFFSFNLAAYVPGAAQQNYALPVGRFSLSSTTTVFLVAQSAFTISTMGGFGIIRARRAR